MNLVLAHGVGGRSDLPIPVWVAAAAGAFVLLISFLGLIAFWRSARFRGAEGGHPSPALQGTLDSAAVAAVLRGIGLVGYLVTLAVLVLGSGDPSRSPAPTWIFVWFWVGLPLVSLLFGPVWRRLNPLRSIAAAVRVLVGGRSREPREYPARLGYWPAAASLFAFVWLELAYKDASRPAVLLGFVLIYSIVHVAFGARYGPQWFARADGFEVYSDVIGRLAPIGRRGDGRAVLRNPFDGLASLRPRPGLVAVICVLLGSTGFDGLSRTQGWVGLAQSIPDQPGNALLGTLGLVVAIAAVAGIYRAATGGRSTIATHTRHQTGVEPAALFVHSLVPIVLGYTTAHYFSFFLFQGQVGYILASDPFGWGWNLFGTAGWPVNYTAVSTTTIGFVQVAAIVLGHVVGVVAAHDRALEVLPHRDQVRGQFSLIAAMVAFTCGGIGLLVGSG